MPRRTCLLRTLRLGALPLVLAAVGAGAGAAAARTTAVHRGPRVLALAASGHRAAVLLDVQGLDRSCPLRELDVLDVDHGGAVLARRCPEFEQVDGLAQDDLRTTWIEDDYGHPSSFDNYLHSAGPRGLRPLDEYESIDYDVGGSYYGAVAGGGRLTAALGLYRVGPGSVSNALLLATPSRRRSLAIPNGATAVAVGDDGRAYLATERPGVVWRVGMRGPLVRMGLVPAPPSGARILAAAGRLVAVSPGAVAVYDAATRRRHAVLPLAGSAGPAALHGTVLVVADLGGVVAVDVACGRTARIVDVSGATGRVRLVAASDAGALAVRSRGSRSVVVLVPWQDVREALAR